MAFGKSLYLLEALLPADRETVCYSHKTRQVTEIPMLLKAQEFAYVTVSNLVKLFPDNCFVLRMQPVSPVLPFARLGLIDSLQA
jgi:hypothetical protein